jgi:integrase
VGPLIAQCIEEKRACGDKYGTESHLFRRLDRCLCAEGLTEPALPRDLLERWRAKQSHERATTHRLRIGLTRRLAMCVTGHGYPASIPATPLLPRTRSNFVARIFTHDEVRRLLEAADHIRPDAHTPWRAHLMPELFRLLYSCGLRISEALH